MRRKSSGGYNQHRKQRYQNGGSGQNNYGNRPRKNWPALREKYLTQARDALSSGDRVLAENYFQHADHCYRMMMEEGTHHQRPHQNAAAAAANGNESQPVQEEAVIPQNTNALPAFLTAGYEQPPVDPATIQNWEERDA